MIKRTKKQMATELPHRTDFDVQSGIAENLMSGDMEMVGRNERGEPLYRLTAKGIKAVEEMLRTSQLARAFLAKLKKERH